MKKLTFLFLTFLFLLTFHSCKKEEVKPVNNNVLSQDDKSYEILNIDWVLSSGVIYMDNMNTNEKKYYDHFGSTQAVSFLDPINGAAIPFDTIVRGVTTWRFTSDSYFLLNGVNFYETTKYDNTFNVIGMEGGTARPITILDITENTLVVRLNEDFAAVPGVASYEFYSVLTFVRSGTTCNSCEPDAYYGWTYGGLVNIDYTNGGNSGDTPSDIIGTRWLVTRVLKNFANEYPNDTLYFVSPNLYTINSGPNRSYTLTTNSGSNMFNFTLYSFLSLGGDYSGNVISTFISDGELNGIKFDPVISNSNSQATVWMEKLP